MIDSTRGIILRTRRLTETSLIVNWLTPDAGRVSTVAKGALRPKSPFRGKLDLFYEADFSFARSRRSELHTLREVSLRETHPGLRREIAQVRQASYAVALIEQVTERETPLPAIYDLLRDFLEALPNGGERRQALFAFELKLLDELGLRPDFERGGLAPGTRRLAAALMAGEWALIPRLRPGEVQAAQLRRFLQAFMLFHLGKLPKMADPAGG